MEIQTTKSGQESPIPQTENLRNDNHPSILCLQVRQCVYVPTCGGNGGWWADTSNSILDPIAARTSSQAADALSEKYQMDINQDFLAEFDLIEWWETTNVFLSEEGFCQHLALTEIPQEYRIVSLPLINNPEFERIIDQIK